MIIIKSLFFILFATQAVASETFKQGDIISGQAHVLDGDTIKINNVSLRFFGIDAPEKKQTCLDGEGNKYLCGSRSALFLYDLVYQKTVSCTVQSVAGWGRYSAICEAGGIDLNAMMVQSGHALNYSKYGTNKLYPRREYPNGLYESQELIARDNKAGIWQGEFVFPWIFRKEK